MQIRPIMAFSDGTTTVNLLDGTSIPYASITFDASTYHFYAAQDGGGTPLDITSTLTRADKLTFPGFDPAKDNNRLSYDAGRTQTVDQAGISPLDPLPTAVLPIFAQNVESTVQNPFGSTSPIAKYAKYALGAVVVYMAFQLYINRRK